MSETAIDTATTKLFQTLNTAIESGMEKIPVAAEYMLTDLSKFYYASGIGSSIFVGLWVVNLFVFSIISYSNMKKVENEEQPWLFYSIVSFMISIISVLGILISASRAVSNFISAYAPIGSILAEKL